MYGSTAEKKCKQLFFGQNEFVQLLIDSGLISMEVNIRLMTIEHFNRLITSSMEGKKLQCFANVFVAVELIGSGVLVALNVSSMLLHHLTV